MDNGIARIILTLCVPIMVLQLAGTCLVLMLLLKQAARR